MLKDELKDLIKKNFKRETKDGFEFELDVKHFGNQVYMLIGNIPNIDSEPEISILTDIISDLQAFNPNTTEWFKEKIWDHFQKNMERAEFGYVNYEGFENTVEANYAHFKITSPEEAHKALRLWCVGIHISKEGTRSFDLSFSCPWDQEHGITIGVLNHQFAYID